jgi:GMP synthase (glutamine-hydrolysing)
MPTVLAFQHLAFEDLGYFNEIFIRYGYHVQILEVPVTSLENIDPLAADVWIILGGPIGVYETDSYPFLLQELELIEKRLAAGKPILGICLGCQLIAKALGAKVYPATTKELGWGTIQLTAAGQNSCLAALGENEPVLHWHGDTFDLPTGAVLLASTQLIPHQAFSWGTHVLGLQFHVEITAVGIERWLVGHRAEIGQTPNVNISQLRTATLQHSKTLPSRGSKLLDCWLKTQHLTNNTSDSC